MEWTDPVNPFNSLKCLAWADRLQRFYAGQGDPPVTVDIEPTNACNLRCPWCFPRAWRAEHKGGLSAAELAAVPDALSDLGVTAVTLTGGGEPLLHPGISELMRDLLARGIHFALITNGTRLDHADPGLLCSADWIGVSLDAATRETWSAMKGADPCLFDLALDGIRRLSPRVPITYKMVVSDANCHEIGPAIERAQDLGCASFHARPAWGGVGDNSAVERAIELARPRLVRSGPMTVNIVTHKISTDGLAPKPFRRCVATPLLLTVCADGQCYTCQDHRGESEFRLCSIGELAANWGSLRHREMIGRIDPRACGKCTFSGYNATLAKIQPEYL